MDLCVCGCVYVLLSWIAWLIAVFITNAGKRRVPLMSTHSERELSCPVVESVSMRAVVCVPTELSKVHLTSMIQKPCWNMEY